MIINPLVKPPRRAFQGAGQGECGNPPFFSGGLGGLSLSGTSFQPVFHYYGEPPSPAVPGSCLIPFSVFGFQFSVKKICNINKLIRWFVAFETKIGLTQEPFLRFKFCLESTEPEVLQICPMPAS